MVVLWRCTGLNLDLSACTVVALPLSYIINIHFGWMPKDDIIAETAFYGVFKLETTLLHDSEHESQV